MRPIQRIISVGFATAAIAAASMPAMSWTVWPDVDFEWYANVGRTANAVQPAQVRDDMAVQPGDDQPRGYDLAPLAPTQDNVDRAAFPSQQPEGRRAPSLPESELVSPTLPYSGSNRR